MSHMHSGQEIGEGKLCWVPCFTNMGTVIKAALPLLLLLQGLWALDVPLEGESPHCCESGQDKLFTLIIPLHSACSQAAPYHR